MEKIKIEVEKIVKICINSKWKRSNRGTCMNSLNKFNCASLDILEELYSIYRKMGKLSREKFQVNRADIKANYERIKEVMDDFNNFLKRHADLFDKSGRVTEFEFYRVQNIIRYCLKVDDHHPSGKGLIELDEFLESLETQICVAQNQHKVTTHEQIGAEMAELSKIISDKAADANKKINRTDLKYKDVQVADINSLIVYANLNTIGCKLYFHDVRAESKKYANTENGGVLDLPVQHCHTCNKIFMGEETYKIFAEQFKALPKKRAIKDFEDFDDDFIEENFEKESLLHKYGYNVRKDGPSVLKRREILMSVIKNRIMTYANVISLLESNIKMNINRANMKDAVIQWRSDIEFLGKRVLDGTLIDK